MAARPGQRSATSISTATASRRYEEYRAWRQTGSSFDGSKVGGLDLQSPLGYSDGTKTAARRGSGGAELAGAPAYGLANPTQVFPDTYKAHGTRVARRRARC